MTARTRCTGFAFLLVLLTPSSAQAEFGIVPGSTIAKAHSPIPLVFPSGDIGNKCAESPPAFGPPSCRISRLDGPGGIRAAAPIARAGAHPDASGSGELADTANFKVKDFFLDSPPGFLGNPTVVPSCDRDAFRNTWQGTGDPSKACPPVSQVGVATIETRSSGGETTPVYRIVPSPGSPASFGFRVVTFGIVVNANLRTDGDYGLVISSTDIDAGLSAGLISATVTLWGVPADPVHDPDRWNPTKPALDSKGKPIIREGEPLIGDWSAPSGQPRIPFLQTPTDCTADSLISTARIDSWQEQGRFLPEDPFDPTYAIPAPQPTGCDQLSFNPFVALVPSATNSDSPTGVSVQMEVPQNYDPDEFSTPQLKKAVVTLPDGMSVNPSAADGIEGCTTEQIGLLTTNGAYPNPIRFAKGDANCPQASKLGTGEVETKLLEEKLKGDLYLATPYDNPFHSLLAVYFVFRGPGFVIKLPGKVEADPVTGQLKTIVDYSPQLPFDKLTGDFFGGPRAPVATSSVCGAQRIETTLTPWSTPFTSDATPFNHYDATKGPAGAPCSFSLASRPFVPELTAGTASPIAGGYSPLTTRLTRPDGDQELGRGVTVKPPLGFSAALKGIPYCSEARIAAAEANTGVGETASPSCPAASEVGHALTGTGAGPTPLFTKGTVYLAGPYKGAPLSLAIVNPAIAGGTPGDPVFDLGVVVVRVALHLDPRTAQITAISDPVPQILKGIPLRVKDIRVNLDRPKTGINPTNCEEMRFDVEATGQNGATASLSNRYQAVECASLGFKPRLDLSLGGGTKRGGHPALRAVVRPRKGDANIARAAVTLPDSAFLDQGHIRTVCTRVQFAVHECPQGSIYGYARAITPLFDQPLEGPVYLRSSDNLLPDLVAELNGQVDVELVGRIDSVHGGIRNTFDVIPDAPVSKFTLSMQGGKKGLIINSRNLCAQPSYANARYVAKNGRRYAYRPRVVAEGCAKAARKHKGHRR
jgi:hypothetical protein